ncbi:hypothetical protein [Aquabacterium sp. OR-4]|uniref:hypothetical protein n=1 Tax=Aquabacterium sp. OR-4 TaxID=2978127 RepID=UPI0021B21BD7|nr:hypothetical protein [Aquabacterium sp. OR-4]MDT7834977.1 hypothetical protein [Aquabacterium sp. OR-4]
MTTAERQPMLFDDLPIPAAAPATRAVLARRCRVRVAPRRDVQLVLDFDFREFAAQTSGWLDDEDTAYDFPTRRRTLAGREPPPPTGAASSIWALAAAASRSKGKARPGKPQDIAAPAPLIRVDREDGRVRVVRLRPEETEEWAERERLRRARQRPPKPTKAAKSRGKKVRVWDGEEIG